MSLSAKILGNNLRLKIQSNKSQVSEFVFLGCLEKILVFVILLIFNIIINKYLYFIVNTFLLE